MRKFWSKRNEMEVKEIPGTLGFKISEDGKVYDSDGVLKNTYVNGDGYITAAVKLVGDTWRTFGIHRLLALAHIECPGNPDEYEVNHIDTNVENNTRGNLEWVKSIDNNSHAAVYRDGNKRPLILAYTPEGEPRFFKNVHHVSEVIGKEHEEVWEAIKTGNPIEGWIIKHHRFDDPIPKALHKPKGFKWDQTGRRVLTPVSMRDIETGEIKTYGSMNEAAKAHSTSASHIIQAITKPNEPLRLFRKRYMVVYEGDAFPDPDMDVLETARTRGSKEVVAFNVDEKKLSIHSNAADFYRTYGLSKKAVTTALRVGRLRNINGWVFVYWSPENVEKLVEFVGGKIPDGLRVVNT